jgi:hypothetical protein
MKNSFYCTCIFFNLKFIAALKSFYFVPYSIFFFLIKIRKINKVLRFKKTANIFDNCDLPLQFVKNGFLKNLFFKTEIQKIKNFKKTKKSSENIILKYKNKKKIKITIDYLRNFLFNERILSFENHLFFDSLRKLLTIIKQLFVGNCFKLQSLLIDFFFICSRKISINRIVLCLEFISCRKKFFFKPIFFKFLFFAYKLNNFSLIVPYIRSLGLIKNPYLLMNFLEVTIRFVIKSKIKLFIFEMNEIFLIIKKLIKKKIFRTLNISLKISKNLFGFKKINLVPEIKEFTYGIFKYFKKKREYEKLNFFRTIELFVKDINFSYNPYLFEEIIEFLKNFSNFYDLKENEKVFIASKNFMEEFFLKHKQFSIIFSFLKIKFLVIFSDFEIKSVGILGKIFLKKLIYKINLKKFEKLIKNGFLEGFFGKDMVKIRILKEIFIENMLPHFFFTEKIILEFFKYLFSTINSYSAKGVKERGVLKNSFYILQFLILRLRIKSKSYVSKVSGLLKWSINNFSSVVKKYGARLMLKIIPILHYFKEKILIGHLGIILVNNLKEKNPNVLKYFLRCLRQILNTFPQNYCIPPVRIIFSTLIPLLKNKNILFDSDLISLLDKIIDKNLLYVPKKDLVLLCFNLVKIQKKVDLKIRKISMKIVCKISRLYGSGEVVTFLIDSLEKSNGIYRISIIVALTSLAYEGNLHLILPIFYQKFFDFSTIYTSHLFKGLIFILEQLEVEKLINYLSSLGIIIEKGVFSEFDKINPLLFLLIGKFSQKFRFHGFEKRLVLLLKFILVNIFISPKSSFKYIFFALEKLILSLSPIIWLNFIFQGLIHRKKKIRIMYWKFHRLMNNQKNFSFFFLKFLMGSKRNLLRDLNLFF